MFKRYAITLMGMAVLIGVISVSLVSAADTTATIDFEGLDAGTIVNSLSCGDGVTCAGTIAGSIRVNAFNPRILRNPAADSSFNTAMIFDAECIPPNCSGSDNDLSFPGHGKTMINSEDLDSSDPDDQANSGSFMEFDFSDFGPGRVEVLSIDVGDIEPREDGAFVEHHAGRCFGHPLPSEGGTQALPITGNNGIATTTFDFVGVECLHVHLNGSGTIDNIKLSIPDTSNPDIEIEKTTNGVDADDANDTDVPQIKAGDEVTWTYTVTNPGNVPLANVVVTDDQGVTLGSPSGDISPQNLLLDPGETWIYTATGEAEDLATTTTTTVQGCGTPRRPTYENMGVVTAVVHPVVDLSNTVTANDPSHYCNPPEEGIHIEKATNGVDADDANGAGVPQIEPGDEVTWTYTVTNTGEVPLANVVVTDDQGVTLGAPSGDTNADSMLDLDETWVYTATGVAEDLANTTGTVTIVQGCNPGGTPNLPTYENMGVVTANPVGATTTVTADDPSHYCNPPEPGILIEKATNGVDADDPNDAPQIGAGLTVTWTYTVTNTGEVPLANVVVEDDNGTTGAGDDVTATSVPNPSDASLNIGDTNLDNLLDLTETWEFTAFGTALDLDSTQDTAGVTIVDGCGTPPQTRPTYENMGVVTANTTDATGAPTSEEVSDDDPSHYCNPPEPGILIEKATNGVDADDPNDAPQIAAGLTVTWTYTVTNTGEVPLANVVVEDDNGTQGAGDDVTATSVPNPSDASFNIGDTNLDNLLDLTETWEFTAFGTALDLDSTQDTAGVTIVDGCGTPPQTRNTYENMGVVTANTTDATGAPTSEEVSDDDPSHYCNPPVDVVGQIDIEKYTKIVVATTGDDVCKTLGKPKTFTLRYTGDNVLKHAQEEGKVKVKGTLNGESPVNITSKKDSYENLNIGESFDTEKGEVTIKDGDGEELKEIEFHTSCSQPLVLGDQYGGVQLVGYTSKDGKSATFDPTPPSDSDLGEDADDPTGPEGQVGDRVTWTYVVTNTGNVPLHDVVVTDDNGTENKSSDDFNPTFVSGDDNGDSMLDLDETWVYRETGTVQLGQYANVSDVSGLDTNDTKVEDSDPSHYFSSLPQGDVCEGKGKLKTLTMRYTGEDDTNLVHTQNSGKANASGDPEFASPVHITAGQFFDGEVNLGDTFIINGSTSKLGSNTNVVIQDLNGNLLQTINFHTSCSQPLERGNQFGAIELVDVTLTDR